MLSGLHTRSAREGAAAERENVGVGEGLSGGSPLEGGRTPYWGRKAHSQVRALSKRLQKKLSLDRRSEPDSPVKGQF